MPYISSPRNSLSICYGPNFQYLYKKSADGIDWWCYPLLFHHGTFPSFSVINETGSSWWQSSFSDITDNWKLGSHIAKNQVAVNPTKWIHQCKILYCVIVLSQTLSNLLFTTEYNSGRSQFRWIIRTSPEIPTQDIFSMAFDKDEVISKKLIFEKSKSLTYLKVRGENRKRK